MILQRGFELPAVVMAEVADPAELARAQAQDERFRRNLAWFDAHLPQVYEANRGKVICVAGAELFAADTPQEALALAKAAHPEDDGRFTRYIPSDKACRIYASRW
jgi:hypothetical protein